MLELKLINILCKSSYLIGRKSNCLNGCKIQSFRYFLACIKQCRSLRSSTVAQNKGFVLTVGLGISCLTYDQQFLHVPVKQPVNYFFTFVIRLVRKLRSGLVLCPRTVKGNSCVSQSFPKQCHSLQNTMIYSMLLQEVLQVRIFSYRKIFLFNAC